MKSQVHMSLIVKRWMGKPAFSAQWWCNSLWQVDHITPLCLAPCAIEMQVYKFLRLLSVAVSTEIRKCESFNHTQQLFNDRPDEPAPWLSEILTHCFQIPQAISTFPTEPPHFNHNRVIYRLWILQKQTHNRLSKTDRDAWKMAVLHLISFLEKALDEWRALYLLAAWSSDKVNVLLFLFHPLDVVGQRCHFRVRVWRVETQQLRKPCSVRVIFHDAQFYTDIHIHMHATILTSILRFISVDRRFVEGIEGQLCRSRFFTIMMTVRGVNVRLLDNYIPHRTTAVQHLRSTVTCYLYVSTGYSIGTVQFRRHIVSHFMDYITGQINQATASEHWRTMVSQPVHTQLTKSKNKNCNKKLDSTMKTEDIEALRRWS